jgi:hypothetical protein
MHFQDNKNNQKAHFSYADIYPLNLLDQEHDGLDIISMEEYLTREAGNFRDKFTGTGFYPHSFIIEWIYLTCTHLLLFNPSLRYESIYIYFRSDILAS